MKLPFCFRDLVKRLIGGHQVTNPVRNENQCQREREHLPNKAKLVTTKQGKSMTQCHRSHKPLSLPHAFHKRKHQAMIIHRCF